MASAPVLTFLGGVGEIGGNKIVLEDGPDRVLFDFGPSFSPRFEEFWQGFLQPRSTSPVKDRLEFQLLPRVEGLYSEESLAGCDLRPTEPRFHGVFVTHAHADHAGYLGLIDPRIPVYVGGTSRRLLEAISATTTSADYGNHDFRQLTPGSPVRVGQLEVVPLPVDHSIPGALGYLVRTSTGTVVYTGDFRMHGPRAADTHEFIRRASAEDDVTLITEGTRVSPTPRRNLSESGVRDGVDRLLDGTDALAIVTCYPRDVDRLTTLYEAAVAAERDFVVSLKTAYLLESLGPVLGRGLPQPGRAPNLKVYVRSKKSYYKWERPFLDGGVDAEYVRKHGAEILLSLDLAHFAELIDLQPPAGAPFIHSMSEPFSEDDVDDLVLQNWLDHFRLRREQMHASGHASAAEIGQAARTISPKSVIPIHTEHPELFRDFAPAVRIPRTGEPIPLRG